MYMWMTLKQIYLFCVAFIFNDDNDDDDDGNDTAYTPPIFFRSLKTCVCVCVFLRCMHILDHEKENFNRHQ